MKTNNPMIRKKNSKTAPNNTNAQTMLRPEMTRRGLPEKKTKNLNGEGQPHDGVNYRPKNNKSTTKPIQFLVQADHRDETVSNRRQKPPKMNSATCHVARCSSLRLLLVRVDAVQGAKPPSLGKKTKAPLYFSPASWGPLHSLRAMGSAVRELPLG